jgi:hypothetical protein
MVDRRWLRVAEIARQQFGVVSLRQLLGCGLTDDVVLLASRKGHLHRLHRSVYSVGFRPVGLNSRLMAAALSCEPSGVVSHTSAGGLQGFLKPRSGLVHITITGRAGRRRRSVRIHRPRSLEAAERGRWNGIPCTSPSRTIIDIAAEGVQWQTEKAIAEAEGLGLLDVEEIERLYVLHPGRPGSVAVRTLLGTYEPVEGFTRSGFERRMVRLCMRGNIALPQTNVLIATDSGTFEADCLWRAERLIIECDSHRWHDNPVTAESDALKDQAFTDAGWRVHRLRWSQIVRASQRAAQTVRNLLEQQRRLFRPVV